MTGPRSPFSEAPEFDRTGALDATAYDLAAINASYAVVYLGHGTGLGSVSTPGVLWTSFGLSSDSWVHPPNTFSFTVPRRPNLAQPGRTGDGVAA